MDFNVDLMLNQPEFMSNTLIKNYNHNQANSHWQTLCNYMSFLQVKMVVNTILAWKDGIQWQYNY